jgi:hypothetical protein
MEQVLKLNRILLVITLLLFAACDGGLEPTGIGDKTFLNGTLHFVGGPDAWPEDSTYAVRVAAFKALPDSNILEGIQNGEVYFTLFSLPLEVDTASFSFEIEDAPVNIVYIAAVRQEDSTDIFQQRVIGIYSETGNKLEPSELFIEKGRTYNVDIEVDFNDFPPMPF